MLSIGVDEAGNGWRTCLLEDGRSVELRAFVESAAVLAYLEQTCATYPESIMMVALDEMHSTRESHEDFCIAIETVNRNTWCLPPVHTLGTIPAHRHVPGREGSGHMLAGAAALLYRLRQRESTWDEMRFLLLEVDGWRFSVVVIENGRVVNCLGILPLHTGLLAGEQGDDQQLAEADASVREEAFWEQLTQGLSGLLAVHHLEDIVILGACREEVIARFEDMYAFYDFPREEQEPEGYEAAYGAALLAASLTMPGIAAEVAARLQLSLVQPLSFS